MKPLIPLFVSSVAGLAVFNGVLAEGGTPYVGSTATLSTIEEGVSGTVTVTGAQTLQVDHFYYNGGGISVYFRLGTNNTGSAFANGLSVGNQLVGHAFTNASLTLTLPSGQFVNGYNAISVYCVDAHANFGSGAFVAPAAPHLDSILQTNGVTSVVLSGELDKHYELQSSRDLTNWEDLELGTNTIGTLTFMDTNQFDHRFYRAVVK